MKPKLKLRYDPREAEYVKQRNFFMEELKRKRLKYKNELEQDGDAILSALPMGWKLDHILTTFIMWDREKELSPEYVEYFGGGNMTREERIRAQETWVSTDVWFREDDMSLGIRRSSQWEALDK